MAKKRPPCMRNLDRFKKNGCPEKAWDGEEGCQCWKELTTTTMADAQPKLRKMCIDEWMFDLKLTELGLLEGNQQAMEAFRNGMLDTSNPNELRPKPDAATIHLINLLHEEKNKRDIIQDYEDRKQLEDKEQNING
ncbi:MAG: hypothetical protein V3V27_01605 [Candidatus Thermoplasmatota archaeon]